MKKNVMVTIMVVIMMATIATPAMAHNWVEGHHAYVDNGELLVDGNAVCNVIIPDGDVNAIPVIVYDPDSAISTWVATANSAFELCMAVANQGGYAILVVPDMGLAFIGEYKPGEGYFGYNVTDTFEF